MTASAEVRVPCAGTFDETLAFFCDRLGFHVERIYPADRPRLAVLSGRGIRVRLDGGRDGAAPALVIRGERGRSLLAPNGSRIDFEPIRHTVDVPPLEPAWVVTEGNDADWNPGRAGMQYRDLIPGRLGGRFIASHIRIEAGGSVPDYVHYHRVRFQMIYVRRGWVRVVYEDQGEPFIMRAGDCVLQPPTIRHRVLRSSPGLEVIEIGCPAEHETLGDPGLQLPTERVAADRDFEGQRFVHHVAAEASWEDTGLAGVEGKVFGLARATDGLAEAMRLRTRKQRRLLVVSPEEFLLLHVLAGSAKLGARTLSEDACCVLPPETGKRLTLSPDTELLLVTLPARAPADFLQVL